MIINHIFHDVHQRISVMGYLKACGMGLSENSRMGDLFKKGFVFVRVDSRAFAANALRDAIVYPDWPLQLRTKSAPKGIFLPNSRPE